jgi:uncharacterized protein YdaU (DUF1376 family)
MSEIKWYKRDPNSALTGMMCLTLEERGAYNTVLDLIYTHGGKVIDDDRFLSGWMRCDIRVWKRIKKTLLELGKLEISDGHLTNLRATCEIDEAMSRAIHKANCSREAGLASAAKRKAQFKENKELESTPVERPVQPYARATTTTTTREVSKRNAKKHSPAYTREFEIFHELYPPNNGSKFKAFEIYEKLTKAGVDHGRIEHGARAYADSVRREGTEKRFIAHATTWLNQRRWESDYTPQLHPPRRGDPATNAFNAAQSIIARRNAAAGISAGSEPAHDAPAASLRLPENIR